jgi:hypothetical protein
MIGKKKLDFAKALRAANQDDAKRITAHFEAQNDLFTQCPKCQEKLRGTRAQITSHVCGKSS